MVREKQDIAATRRELISELSDLFSGNEAVSIARMVLDHVGYSEYTILKNPSAEPEQQIRSKITKIVNELQKNRPIQYILGETRFFDLHFYVDERVLIPRPETEELVSQVLQESHSTSPRILDIGTGSGCIAITLSHYLSNSKTDAIDSEPGTIEVARNNAARNNAAVNFYRANILELADDPGEVQYDLIVSNPPYVTQTDQLMMHPRVTKNEPGTALFVSDADPLVFYRAIAKYGLHTLAKGGAAWVEINERFGNETKALFKEAGFKNTRLMKDIHGKVRFIKAEI